MRIFLITLVASVVPSVALWQFGISHKIWPAHPLLATTLIAWACGISVQTWLKADADKQKSK
jgi:hypothetical protein